MKISLQNVFRANPSSFAGKVVAKFCAKYLHQQVLKNEAYSAGDVGASLQKAFFRLIIYLLEYSFI